MLLSKAILADNPILILSLIHISSERVFEFLDEEEEDITVENPVKPDHIEGSVEFSHVHLSLIHISGAVAWIGNNRSDSAI